MLENISVILSNYCFVQSIQHLALEKIFGSGHNRWMEHRCPTCRRPAQWEGNKWRPFCSERCRLLDLGAWSGESYRIPEEADESGEAGESWSEELGTGLYRPDA
jgi:endogenous inhibitor of DNA gyrase (YacG/DUF329 family)